MIGREDESKVTKWKWFNKQVRDTLLCSLMIIRKLVDGSNIGRAIGRLLNLVYAPSAGMRNSVGSTTSLFHISMVANPGSNDHLRISEQPTDSNKSNDHLHIHKFICKGLLSLLSKKQQNKTVSMNNDALGFDYKWSITCC